MKQILSLCRWYPLISLLASCFAIDLAFGKCGQSLVSQTFVPRIPTIKNIRILFNLQGVPTIYQVRTFWLPPQNSTDPVVLLLPGIDDTVESYIENRTAILNQIEAKNRREGFLIIDMIGQGGTMEMQNALPPRIGVEDQVALVREVLRHYQVKDLIITAVSYGGGIAQKLAEKPESINILQMILFFPYVYNFNGHRPGLQGAINSWMTIFHTVSMINPVYRMTNLNYLKNHFHTNRHFLNPKIVWTDEKIAALALMTQDIFLYNNIDGVKQISNIPRGIRIIMGDASDYGEQYAGSDGLVPHHAHEYLVETIRQAGRVTVDSYRWPGRPHLSFHFYPQEAAQLIFDSIDGVAVEDLSTH